MFFIFVLTVVMRVVRVCETEAWLLFLCLEVVLPVLNFV